MNLLPSITVDSIHFNSIMLYLSPKGNYTLQQDPNKTAAPAGKFKQTDQSRGKPARILVSDQRSRGRETDGLT